jgi:hypothetical protein
MNEFQFSIGRDEQSDIVIQDKTVSKHHALLTVRYYDDITLEDAGSKNGTYINERRIIMGKLHGSDTLRFGDYQPDMKMFFQDVFNKFRSKKTDFSREYQEMLLKFKEYQIHKDKLVNMPIGPLLFRIGISVLVIAILGLWPDFIPDNNIRFLIMTSVGLVSIIGSVIGPSQSKKQEKLDKLRLAYEDKLVCPKCNIKLIQNNYSYYEGRKKCINDKCDAIYQA